MAAPRMYIIAGPPGAGKSSMSPVSAFAGKAFNADDRAAELNGGSYASIPLSIREAVNREFECFVLGNIRAKSSFAIETTLRSRITFDQAKMARAAGFRTSMRYIALDTVDEHIRRVRERAAAGGHAASETTLRRIHAASLSNLPVPVHPERSGIELVRITTTRETSAHPSSSCP